MGLTERSFLERMELMGLTESRAVTNGDRFRAMKDEELAKWFETHACCMIDPFFCSKPGGSCNACWLDWLRQEAEDAFN